MDDRHRELQALLAALGHDSRFRLTLCLLEGERCVGDLARAIGLSQSCTTRHVQSLERAGIVHSRRDGKRVFVGIETERAALPELVGWLAREGGDARATVEGPRARGRTKSGAGAGPGRRGASRPSRPRPERPPRRAEPARPPVTARERRSIASSRAPATPKPATAPAQVPPAVRGEEAPPTGTAASATHPPSPQAAPSAARRPYETLEDYLL